MDLKVEGIQGKSREEYLFAVKINDHFLLHNITNLDYSEDVSLF